MRSNFDKQLVVLNTQLVEMATLVENSIDITVEALLQSDDEKAKQVIEFEKEIDLKEKEIETLCLKLLLQQQPVAKDLRQVSAALKMITDMERIGDQSRDIAEIILSAPHNIQIRADGNLIKMASATIKMVHDVVDSFVKTDLELAHSVVDSDDVVDELYIAARTHLVEVIRSQTDGVEMSVDLLSIAKYFERIGDHATNIAEWVIYSITGIHESN